MPPAFNLSQDQTLQFNACYCFRFMFFAVSCDEPVAHSTY